MKYSRVLISLLICFVMSCKPGVQSNAHLIEPVVHKPELLLPNLIVGVDWLKQNLTSEHLTVIDVRNKEDYLKGHIPGAVNCPVNLLNRDDKAKGNLRTLIEMNKIFSDIGVNIQKTVVICGDNSYRKASRFFWALEVHGHMNVAVLDGGIEAWQKDGSGMEMDVFDPVKQQFVARFYPGRLADKLEVLRAIGSDSVIIDSRSGDEYLGLKTKGKRKGHITSALSYPANNVFSVLDDACKLNDINDLKNTYGALDKSKKVFLYCNSGRSATVNYLVLRLLDYQVSVYDGSWNEWSEDVKLPVSTGKLPGELE